jgi:hypothetical protein
MPTELQDLITGELNKAGTLPDCADVALLLRHYYLAAKGKSFTFKAGASSNTAETFTLGKGATNKEVRACLLNVGTGNFQEERKGFALVDFYKQDGKKVRNLKSLRQAGLKSGDLFVWKRLPTKTGNFQGQAQTVQAIKWPTVNEHCTLLTGGSITLAQGTMEGGEGKGRIEQRTYTFADLTGQQDGDAEITIEPTHREEEFFGAGPWKE